MTGGRQLRGGWLASEDSHDETLRTSEFRRHPRGPTSGDNLRPLCCVDHDFASWIVNQEFAAWAEQVNTGGLDGLY